MDLSTSYLGLTLKNPIIASASPLSRSIDTARRLEDNGVAAIVMYSLFEEQIVHEQCELDAHLAASEDIYAESPSYFPEPASYGNVSGEDYLEQLYRLKKSLGIPVIASLNGVSPGGWMKFASRMQEAGADALELNIYHMAVDHTRSGAEVEQLYLDDLRAVKSEVSIPVAVKVGPYFSSFAHFARRLDQAGADGLVLFNRFFGPDIDLEALEVTSELTLSSSWEMRLALRWIAVLCGKVAASIAATTGVRSGGDVVKLLLAGADAVMVASILLERGPDYVHTLITELHDWFSTREYRSIAEIRGLMSHHAIDNPAAYERSNYMKMLQSYQ